MRRSLSAPLAVFALTLLVFGAWMHWAVLLPGNVGWVLDGNDRGQSAVGLAAYLRAGGPWPLLHQPLLAAPEGMTLLFTDSIPLLGLVLKPFAPLLGQWQFIGWWYLACVALQASFAWALVRRHAPDALAAWFGAALLTAMPALINRYGHASLCAQWLILWAMWVFVDSRRARRPLWWAAVLGVAALVHSYLLLMVAAIWGSAVLRLLVRDRRRGWTLLGAAAVLGTTAAIVAMDGVYGQHFISTRSYGSWPVALDAWWNPANPSYTALLPSTPDQEAQGFEGLQYLGAGLLALVLAGVAALLRGCGPRRDRATLAKLVWLLPAFGVLAVVAIGPAPLWRGEPVFTLHIGRRAVDLLDPVRAAGRLVWPMTYTIAFTAVLLAFRWRRASLVLAAALALQVVDLAPMFASIRTASALADDYHTYRRTTDPRWDAMVARASAVQFEPAERFVDLAVMEEVAWRAVGSCRPSRYFYASRDSQATQRRVAADSAAFRRGELDPSRLYVLLDRRVPAGLATRVQMLDGIPVIAPTRQAGSAPCG